MHPVNYREALESLLATPPSLPRDFLPDDEAAQEIVRKGLRRPHLARSAGSRRLLGAYWIPIVPALFARDPEEAVARLLPSCFPRETGRRGKILSPDIVHKSEVGGVRLNF